MKAKLTRRWELRKELSAKHRTKVATALGLKVLHRVWTDLGVYAAIGSNTLEPLVKEMYGIKKKEGPAP